MIVNVKQGKLEGHTQKSVFTGDEFFAFQGIPYAKPPIGNLRFQSPQPLEKWNGTLSAKKPGSHCIQKDVISKKIIGSEDCLYLNVYTPKPPSQITSPKAVMVFIHGGSYVCGSGSTEEYSADYLIGYDVILVTLNYRLHVLGFLNMGTENSVDNCGLRDQCSALKWINENIAAFGGDSKNITIFGESAGGTSVYCLMVSPLSKGLFHKGIIQSDSVLYAIKKGNNGHDVGFEVGKRLGYVETDPEKLVEFLKKKSAYELCETSLLVYEAEFKQKPDGIFTNVFAPAPKIAGQNAFLPDTIENLAKMAEPIPLIAGMTNKEGKTVFTEFAHDLLQTLKSNFTLPIETKHKMNLAQFAQLCNKVKMYYLEDEPIGEQTADKIVDIYTDCWFKYFYEAFDFVTRSDHPLYDYEFSFVGKFNITELQNAKKVPKFSVGACHCDDLPYLFYPEANVPRTQEFTDPEVTVIRNMCSLWTNFAKYGNPTQTFTDIKWKPFTSLKPYFLRINNKLELVNGKFRETQFEFWRKLLN